MLSKSRIEMGLHILFWIFMLLSINVDWSANWFDQSLRPKSPAPLSVIMFAAYFYINAFLLIPRFFNKTNWIKYILFALMTFCLPELIRILFYTKSFNLQSWQKELFNRDSFIFGAPGVFFMSLNLSFIYRFTIDWFVNNNKLKQLEQSQTKKEENIPYENSKLLNDEEVSILKTAIQDQMETNELYLNPDLSL
ncbi:MAG: hypothetical protein AAGK97_16960, partial [Bacteroidota bacterium]